MAGFISWNDEYRKWLDALANRRTESFFSASHENKQQQRVMYRKLGDVKLFTEWLAEKAAMEREGYSDGSIMISIGGA